MKEDWRPVVGWKGLYEASSLGMVRGVARVLTTSDGREWERGSSSLTPSTQRGYERVCLSGHDKKQKVVRVHRLVALTFLESDPERECVNHIDGVKTNNRADNLEWCTPSENMKHAYLLGLKKCSVVSGENSPNAKLSKNQVEQIKERLRCGERNKHLAADYGVRPETISAIKTGKTWGHI